MAIRDLITSDPYYQNLVNPRGFPTGNDPYVAPTFDDPEPKQIQPEFGIQSIINPYLQNQGNDGNNQNVRTDYRPNYDFRKSLDYDPSLSATANQKQFDMAQNYYNAPPLSATGQFLNQAMNFMPGIGAAKKAAEFLGGLLPPNQRAILENELRGSGVYTDDIGRVVGDINTAEGVMAGYNANKITDQTYTNRRNTIANTLSEKYGMSQADIDAAIDGTYTGNIETDLIGRLSNLNKSQFILNNVNKTSKGIIDFQNKKRNEKKEAKLQEKIRQDNIKAAQDAINASNLKTIQQRASQGDSMSDIGRDMYTGPGQAFEKQSGGSSGKKGTSTERNYGGRKDGGRIGYNQGGLASMFTRRR